MYTSQATREKVMVEIFPEIGYTLKHLIACENVEKITLVQPLGPESYPWEDVTILGVLPPRVPVCHHGLQFAHEC